MRVTVGEISAHGGDVADADIGKPAHAPGNNRRVTGHGMRTFKTGKRHHCADGKLAIGLRGDAEKVRAQSTQAYEATRPEDTRFHHQHQCRASGNRAHRIVVGLEECNGLLQRRGLREFERSHELLPGSGCANAARILSLNCRSISLAFERSTRCPMLPSLPVKAASTS